MKSIIKNSIKIVFVIIASFVGAGFASGKELYSFFFVYGIKGVCGIIISSFIISIVIYKVFCICRINNIKSYSQFCNCIVKDRPVIANILNNIVNIFLLITFFIMIAGFSSLLEQEFRINKIVGALIIVVLNYIVSLKSVKGLEKTSNYLVSIFIFFLFIILAKNSNYLNLFKYFVKDGAINEVNNINWLIKSILYAAYNCVVLIPVVVIMKKNITNKKVEICVSIFNLIIIILLSLSIYNLLLLGNEDIYKLDMPIIGIVNNFGVIYKYIYIILISISIFTTATSSGISFLNNINNEKSFKKNLLFISILAIPLAKISFGMLVNCLYPALGIIGLLEIILLFIWLILLVNF